jgi:hypothetical protein
MMEMKGVKVMVIRYSVTAIMLLILCSWPVPVKAQKVATAKEATSVVALRNVKEKGDVISGEVVNKSSNTIRNITLLIQYHWLWKNEYKPGSNPPGRAAYIDLKKDLLPGESTSFTYEPKPPLPNRMDGHFVHEVSVAGFSTVIPPRSMSSR